MDIGRQRGHRCGMGKGDKLHLLTEGRAGDPMGASYLGSIIISQGSLLKFNCGYDGEANCNVPLCLFPKQ